MGKDVGTSHIEKMYEEYFLDYASYVILERAVPAGEDGLKPVQRRILHSMRKMHDGRYHKVANIIGQTMQYHPHGDAAIGAALVNMGQKDLLIDCQGNWGDIRTGDSSAAPRYIEARLTPFALDVLFNPDITQWQLSYDGRNKEPIHLPAKFPLVLAQGAEGIAVGLSTRILPHNFCEIIQASIKILEGKKATIYPDFQTAGLADVNDYQEGKRGGKVKVRARIETRDKSTLAITELPYGVTTSQLIDSILKANDKGKIKVKSVTDNTAKDVEILIKLNAGVAPDIATDALYAFSNCEISISPNACVIINDKPIFLTVSELLHTSAEQTRRLLGQELMLKRDELAEKWHFASLEKVFIEERIYRDMEECESWDEVLDVVTNGLHKYVQTPANQHPETKKVTLKRDISEEDVTKLTEIKIKRISKYNVFKADEAMKALLEEIEVVNFNIEHLTDFTIAFYNDLLAKYGKGKERKTVLTTFGQIEARQVVVNNTKLYVNRKEGFIGYGLKKEEFVCDCSDMDDIIAITKAGNFMVSRISDKTFMGKNILFAGVWIKGDERTTYNIIHSNMKKGISYAKRFQIKAITRDRSYDLSGGAESSQIKYLSVNPNGEAEVIQIKLSKACKARIKEFEFNFADLAIKGRASRGNTVTKYPIQYIKLLESGESTLESAKFWLDKATGRILTSESDIYLGPFDEGEFCLLVYKSGSYELIEPEENRRVDIDNILIAKKFDSKNIISVVYYDGNKKWTMVKRFQIDTLSSGQKFPFISEHDKSELLFLTLEEKPVLQYSFTQKKNRITDVLKIHEFIAVKNRKALGNKLVDKKIKIGKALKIEKEDSNEKLHPGDTIDFNIDGDGQGELF
jgi:topoisomerase-4 subunit A